jgi:uncharacterized membrane protein
VVVNTHEEIAMQHSNTAINAAVASILALGLGAGSQAAFAADQTTEKCAGIVKASQNDCATSTTACHGHVHVDSHPEAWIYLPKGSCEKIVGGRISAQKAPDERAAADEPHTKKPLRRPFYRSKG